MKTRWITLFFLSVFSLSAYAIPIHAVNPLGLSDVGPTQKRRLPDVLPQTWSWNDEWHPIVLSNGQRFQMHNPARRPELKKTLEDFQSYSLDQQKSFQEKRQFTLNAMARLLSVGRAWVKPTVMNSLLEFVDARMLESVEGVLNSTDYGLTVTSNLSAGAAISKGGFLIGTGAGFNFGFVPSLHEAYVEVVADFENLNQAITPVLQLDQTVRVFFYHRASEIDNQRPIEVGRRISWPLPSISSINTDRGFYVGAAYGGTLLPFLPGVIKNYILPLVNDFATYTMNLRRAHLLRAAVNMDSHDGRLHTSIEAPILNHPALAAPLDILNLISLKTGKFVGGLADRMNRAEDKLYESWPAPQNCITTLGLNN